MPELINPASVEGTALTTIDPSAYSVAIESIGTVSINLETVPYTNIIRAAKDTLTTTITTPDTSASTSNTCKLYLSTDSTTNNSLVLADTAEDITPDTNSIPASTGTLDSPAPLTGNSWGYALSSTTPGLPTSGFDEDYETELPAVDKDSKWAGVPIKTNEQLFQTIPMKQSTTTTTNIYYGVSAKDNLQEGSYMSTIIYTAIYEATSVPTGEMTLTPTLGTAGTEITLTTSAVSTMEDAGALDVQLVNPDTQEPYSCEDINTYKTDDNLVHATCKVPNLPAGGEYAVSATHDKTGIIYNAEDKFTYITPFIVFPKYIPVGNSDTHNITITGQNFTGVTSVKLGDADCDNINVKSDTELTCDIGQSATISDETTDFYEAGISSSNATMQSMTPTIKNNVSVPLDKTVTITTNKGSRDADVVYYQEATLKDTRDNKTYTVAKLKDNNIWMTQNLDLDLSTSTTLTSDDTNLTGDVTSWTPSDDTVTVVSSFADSFTEPRSYDPGEEYTVTSGNDNDDTTYNFLSDCTGAGHSESTCKHSHTGNLYNWTASVAENNTLSHTMGGETMPNSICPKGWRLPSGNSTAPSEFGTMLYSQGIIRSNTDWPSYDTDGFKNIRISPLYWVRASSVSNGSRDYLGSGGGYWSSTVYYSYVAYGAFFGSSIFSPRGNDRDYGFSVRCLAV